MDRSVPEEHVGIRIPFQRRILGQSFVHPQRQGYGCATRQKSLNTAAVEHVIDHGMHQFVMQYVTEHVVVAFERHHHAVLEQFRNAADAFFEILIDDVRLLELIVRIVDNHCDAVLDLIPHQFCD